MTKLALVALVLGGIASAAEPPPLKIAAPGLTAVDIPADRASYYAEHLAQQLAFQGMRVITSKEIAALVGLERQKQLLGCNETSCIADIAGALGADAILVGDCAKIGQSVNFNLRLVSSQDGKRLAAFTAKVEGEDAILATLDRGAQLMTTELYTKLGRKLPVATTQRVAVQTGPRSYAWMPAAGGAALAAIGTTFVLLARQNHLELTRTSGVLSGSDATRLQQEGSLYQNVGFTGLALGVAGLGAAGVLFAMGGGSSTVETSVALGPAGAALQFAGTFP